MRVHTYLYAGTYTPPAPVVEIGVRGLDPDSQEVRLTALIDSGADVSMLPIHALQAVMAKHMETRYIRGITGVRQAVETYVALVRIGERVILTAEAIAVVRGNDAILGRDILNQLVVTLDGPAQTVEIGE